MSGFTGEEAIVALAFFMAIVLLDWESIPLPRGDEVVVSGAVVASAVVCVGITEALVVSVLSLLLLGIRRGRSSRVSIEGACVRVAAVVTGQLIVMALAHLGRPVGPSLAALAVPGGYLLAELAGRQMTLARRSGRSLKRLLSGNIRRGSLLMAAQASAGALVVTTYPSMGAWSLVPVVPLLLLIRQSYALLLDIRDTYRTTVRVLVEAAEGDDDAWNGHGHRTAVIARAIGTQCGLSASELDHLGYAALLHDINHLAADTLAAPTMRSSGMLKDVAFLSNVLPVLRVVEGDRGTPEPSDRVVLMGFVVALASDIDAIQTVGLRDSHPREGLAATADQTPLRLKARAVSAALELGYRVPAIN